MKTKDLDFRLRAAQPADALCLSVLATQVFLDTYAFAGITEAVATEVHRSFSQKAFEQILARVASLITVAQRDDALIGFAQSTLGTAQPLIPAGLPAELDRLYVQEPFTRCGVGWRLLETQENLLASVGANMLWLSAWVGNQRALRFYAKHGYEDHGLVYFEMGETKIENRVYAKRLRPEGASQALAKGQVLPRF